MNDEQAVPAVRQLLDDISNAFAALLTVTRRLAANLTPAATEQAVRERSALLCTIESRRDELESIASRKIYAQYECYKKCGHAATLAALDRAIATRITVRMDRIRSELASLSCGFLAARTYLRQSRR